jgi:UDP-glucose 4-epimerase
LRALVTGGAGFIGSHLVDLLQQQKHDVSILDNLSSGRLTNVNSEKVEVCKGDLRRYPDVQKAVKGTDLVFHIGACVGRSVSFPRLDFDTNALGTLNVLKACRSVNVGRVVVASSVMVYGNLGGKGIAKESDPLSPIIPYGASKAAAEAYAMAFRHAWNVPAVVLRFFNVYGPRADPKNPYSGVVSRFLGRACRRLPPIIYGDGKQTRDFIYVKDVARATLLAAERRAAVGEILNVGSGSETTINELASIVIDMAGLAGLKPRHVSTRMHEYRRLHADMTKTRKILGFKAEMSLRTGLKLTWESLGPSA